MNVTGGMPRSWLRGGIVILTFLTSAVHFYLAFRDGLDIMFLLNALGYLALMAGLFLKLPLVSSYKGLIRWVFIGFTLITIVMWLFIGDKTLWFAIPDKLGEALLVVLLFLER